MTGDAATAALIKKEMVDQRRKEVAEELAEQRMDYLGPDGASLTADEAKEVTAILDER